LGYPVYGFCAAFYGSREKRIRVVPVVLNVLSTPPGLFRA